MRDHQLRALRALLEKLEGNDSTTEKIRSIIVRIEKEASSLFEIVSHPDPMKSAVAIDLLINQEKARLRDLVAKSRGELHSIIGGFRAANDAARLAKANLVPDQFASEIRTVFRSLDYTGQMKFMAEAIQAGDASIVAAIVTVPAVLTGLPAAQIDQYRESFLNSIAPNRKSVTDEMQAIADAVCSTAEAAAQPVGAGSPTAETRAAGTAEVVTSEAA